jgi:hypothetical protein
MQELQPDSATHWTRPAPAASTTAPFFCGLFGWGATVHPLGNGQVATLFHREVVSLAALSSISPLAPGQRAGWSTYITVHDLDATLIRLHSAGGSLAVPAYDVGSDGRMALLQDPAGAFFALWEPRVPADANPAGAIDGLVWNEYAADQSRAAAAFYARLLDLALDSSGPVADPAYYAFHAEDTPGGGVLHLTDSWSPGRPDWGVYFTVPNVATAVDNAAALGGGLLSRGAGLALLHDPWGGLFCVAE